jgi:hypothetical protein
MLGPWEWLIALVLALVLATVVAWRFWPKSWRVIPGMRFSIRWLMVAVLVVGLICGGFARWYARRAQMQARIAQLHAQQQVTNLLIQQGQADLRAAGRKNLSYFTGNSFGPDGWTERLDAYESPDGRSRPLISIVVSGGCAEDLLQPITIRTSGAPLEGQLLDRLIDAYRTRGWQHEVIPLRAAEQ